MDSGSRPASLKRLDDATFVYTRPLDGYGGDVSSVLFLGKRSAAVIDSLCSPRDMRAFARMAAGKRVFVVYTHADWDHCLGSAAFDSPVVIGHDLTRARLMAKEHPSIQAVAAGAPDLVEGWSIVIPSITFSDSMVLAPDGGAPSGSSLPGNARRFHLSRLPGHTTDSVVCFEETTGILAAGDVAEDPFPSVGDPASIGEWASGLERWASVARMVVPGHGKPQGPGLLLANARYLRGLLALVKRAVGAGEPPECLARDFPLKETFPEAMSALMDMRPRDRESYVAAHRENLMRTWSALS